MEKYIFSHKAFNPTSRKTLTIANTEDNILDLLALANEELERKSKLIFDLQNRIEYLEGKNLDKLDENQLTQLSNFYGNRLSSVVTAINNLNTSQK